MKKNQIIIIILITVLFTSCEDDYFFNRFHENLIENSSFEDENGEGSIEHWKFIQYNSYTEPKYSEDVPEKGGQKSVAFDPFNKKMYTTSSLVTELSGYSGEIEFKLTSYIKATYGVGGFGSVEMNIYQKRIIDGLNNTIYNESNWVNSETKEWEKCLISGVIELEVDDIIKIQISSNHDRGATFLVDMVEFRMKEL